MVYFFLTSKPFKVAAFLSLYSQTSPIHYRYSYSANSQGAPGRAVESLMGSLNQRDQDINHLPLLHHCHRASYSNLIFPIYHNHCGQLYKAAL